MLTTPIRLDRVCVHFDAVVALAPTTLEIAAGTAVALVGANGSGKTTLLHLIAGLLTPTEGGVTVDGRVALVAQHQQHHPWMPLSVDEVLRMGRFRHWVRPLGRADRMAIDRAADRLGISHLRRRAYGDLSGGQRQRVLVAKALAAEPDVLLLDEPVTGLDLPSQAVILDHLTPPLGRAGLHGELQLLEVLLDEYWEATQLGSERAGPLRKAASNA